MRIDRRFRGPPDSANGGYFAGILAKALGSSDIVVTLRRPAPLDVDLRIERSDQEAALYDGDELLAVAGFAPVDIAVPPPPSLPDAEAAQRRYAGLKDHHYPGCFVCGPERAAGDGWRIFPGSIGGAMVAAGWTPAQEFAGDDGQLRVEFLWAALDCPGYFAVREAAGLALLGRIAVRRFAPVPCGKPLIVTGWGRGSEGRKHRAGTAVHDSGGVLLAVSDQTWISL